MKITMWGVLSTPGNAAASGERAKIYFFNNSIEARQGQRNLRDADAEDPSRGVWFHRIMEF